MYRCNCGREFEKQSSLNSHARFCKLYKKKKKKTSKYKKDDIYVCECGREFDNHQSLNAHFSHCLVHRKGIPDARPHIGNNYMCGWEDKTKTEIAEYKKQAGKTLSKNIELGITTPSFKDRKHTNETKQKMSESASLSNNGYIKTKYYEIFCPYENKNIKVQGSWERTYAEWLNENNINWIRSRKINLKYKLHESDYEHTYFPDFYLPDTDTYVEIKGHWWKSKDGRVDDKRKMEKVQECNEHVKIEIITDIKPYRV